MRDKQRRAILLLVLADLGLIALGVYVWSFRFHVHLSDPTTYHLNRDVTLVILVPALIALVLCAVAWVRSGNQEVVDRSLSARHESATKGYEYGRADT